MTAENKELHTMLSQDFADMIFGGSLSVYF